MKTLTLEELQEIASAAADRFISDFDALAAHGRILAERGFFEGNVDRMHLFLVHQSYLLGYLRGAGVHISDFTPVDIFLVYQQRQGGNTDEHSDSNPESDGDVPRE